MKSENILLLLTAFVLTSCVKEDIVQKVDTALEKIAPEVVFNAGFSDETKTVLVDGKSLMWEAGERISVLCGKDNARFVSTNTGLSRQTEFIGRINRATSLVYAVYPYSSAAHIDADSVLVFDLPSAQISGEGSFSTGQIPCVARTEGYDLHFKNVCGGARITFARSDIESIDFSSNDPNVMLSGSASVTFDDSSSPVFLTISGGGNKITLKPSSGTFEPDVPYYLVLPPVVLKSGYTIQFNTPTSYAQYVTSQPVRIRRNKFAAIDKIDSDIEFIDGVDLSKEGTANSYIVSSSGLYKFKANVKGNSSEPLDGTPASAEVLWESFGTDVMPNVGDIVKNASLDAGYIKFSTPATLNNGNAVIAAKDASGTILWSWHIWVCKDFDPVATEQVYANNAGTMMDRNLGATSSQKGDVHAFGLLYQWGRKDPYMNYGDEGFNVEAKFTSSISFKSNGETLQYSVNNPTTYIGCKSSFQYDWCSDVSPENRWNSNKGICDPCPAGWKVPDENIFVQAFGTESTATYNYYDGENSGITLPPSITGQYSWFPSSGIRACWSNTLTRGSFYSTSAIGSTGNRSPIWLTFSSDGSGNINLHVYDPIGSLAYSIHIRCQKQI